MRKRGSLLLEEIIFFVLNAVFFIVMLVFILNNTATRAVYEQAYAKEIALLIDEAKPSMVIYIDMKKAIELAKNKNKEEIVKINEKLKKITVSLGNTKGKSFRYFNDVNITKEFNHNYLKLTIEK